MTEHDNDRLDNDRGDDRFVDVEHVGGPYDGEYQRVPLDADGQPPAFYMLGEVGTFDPRINPQFGVQHGRTTRLYTLDMVPTDRGVHHVYRYGGEDCAPANDGVVPTLESKLRELGYDIPDPDRRDGREAA